MPYKCVGADLMHMKNGKWSVKQHTKSSENCMSAMRLMMGLEKGTIKKSEVGKPKSRRKYKVLYRKNK